MHARLLRHQWEVMGNSDFNNVACLSITCSKIIHINYPTFFISAMGNWTVIYYRPIWEKDLFNHHLAKRFLLTLKSLNPWIPVPPPLKKVFLPLSGETGSNFSVVNYKSTTYATSASAKKRNRCGSKTSASSRVPKEQVTKPEVIRILSTNCLGIK